MMRLSLALLTAATLSLLFFPWPLTATLVALVALFIPAAPLALGLIADALYWAPGLYVLPLATTAGVLTTILALFVRSRLSPGIIAS